MRLMTIGLLFGLFACAADTDTDSDTDSDTDTDTDTDSDTDTDTDTDTDLLEIAGVYTDSFGVEHEISSETWIMGAADIFLVDSFSNDEDYLIAENDSENEWNPSLWSRFDWVEDANGLWFCQTAYMAASREEALSTSAADISDPEKSGCGRFSWTSLIP